MALTTNVLLRTDKRNIKGEYPVMVTIFVKNILKKIPTGISLLPELWDSEQKQVLYISRKEAKHRLPNIDYDLLPSNEDVNNMNKAIQGVTNELENTAKLFELEKQPYSAEMIAERYKTNKIPVAKRENKKIYFSDYMAERIPVLSFKRNNNTIKVYNTTLRHFQDFQKLKRCKYELKEINYGVFEAFNAYLIKEKELQDSSIQKAIKTLKSILNHAKDIDQLETSTTYKKYHIELKPSKPITLSKEELDALVNLDLNEALSKVRDVFVFACATGLRVSDLKQLRREHIVGNHISKIIEKTDNPISIPLNTYSSAILSKYRHQIHPIPVLSEPYLNRCLNTDKLNKEGMVIQEAIMKKVCQTNGIPTKIETHKYFGGTRETSIVDKYTTITMHTARRTFVSIALSVGLDPLTIREWTGHKDLRSFSAYVDIKQNRLKSEMEKVFGAPETQLKVV